MRAAERESKRQSKEEEEGTLMKRMEMKNRKFGFALASKIFHNSNLSKFP